MDIKTLKANVLNAKTLQKLEDVHYHPSPLSAEADSIYMVKPVLNTAPKDPCLTLKEFANLVDPTVFSAKRRTHATDAYLLMSYISVNAYPNVLLDSLMSLVTASLVLKIFAVFADHKTETTVLYARHLLFLLKENVFQAVLLEDSLIMEDVENVILPAQPVLREVNVLHANLNSHLKEDYAIPSASLEKSLSLTLVLPVKIQIV
jgi:hypothetical protein